MTDTRFKILELLYKNKGKWFPSKEVAEAVGIAHKTARHHLVNLERAGILDAKAVVRDKSGAPKRKYYKFKDDLTLEDALFILQQLGVYKPQRRTEKKEPKATKQGTTEQQKTLPIEPVEKPVESTQEEKETIATTDTALEGMLLDTKNVETAENEVERTEAEETEGIVQAALLEPDTGKKTEEVEEEISSKSEITASVPEIYEEEERTQGLEGGEKRPFVIKVNGVKILEFSADDENEVLAYAKEHFGKKIKYELHEEDGKTVLDINMKFGTKG